MSEPFTIGHFLAWAEGLVLDNGERWRLEQFQTDFLEDVFAGRPENWLIVPEGNGKTTLVAGLGLYGVRFAEDAMIPIAASTRDQVKIMYRQAKGFIRRSGLDRQADSVWFEAFDGYRRVDLRKVLDGNKRGEIIGSMEVHAADAGTGDGVIPFPYCFLDELHRHKSLDLYETWRGKLWKRGGQLVTISTAGEPGSEFEESRKQIRDSGSVERRGRTYLRVAAPEIVLHEHAVPDDGDVEDLELVAEANPISSVTPATLARKKATPTLSEAHWKRFTCNIAVSSEAELFIDARAWEACGDPRLEVPYGAPVCVGADGSRRWDTTVIAHATALGETINVGATVFSTVEASPHHVLHRGGKIDFTDVEEHLIGLFDRFAPLETAYDPRYLERSMEIVDVRLPSASVIPVEPNSKYARDAYQALFSAVAEGKLRHNGDPVLAAHLSNCAAVRDERNQEIKRLRKIDQSKPIDAVPALALAVWRATLAQPSIYEEREAVAV